MAARFKIIAIEKPDPNDNDLFNYVFWADVPTARQPFYVKLAGTKSAWKDASQADTDQLISGAVAETVETIRMTPGAPRNTLETEAQTRWTAFQNRVTTRNPWVQYGSTWDGTTWVRTGVA